MAVSKRLRYEILRRDNHACRYCGATAPSVTLTVDHVVPVALGGKDDPTNLVTACADCNSGKSSASADSSLVADVAQDAVRWAAAIKQATANAAADREARLDLEQAVWAMFEDVSVPSYKGGGHVVDYFPADWFESIGKFAANGLSHGELVDAAAIAIGSRTPAERLWRYFCGICWRMVERRHDEARAILEPKPEPAPPVEELHLTGEDVYALTSYVHLSTVCDGR